MFKFLLLLSAVMLLQATPTPTPPDTKNPVKPTPEVLARARKMFGYECAICHGDNGNGKTDVAASMQLTLTDLGDAKTLTSRSDAELFDLIKNGKGKMPAEGDRAKTDDIWGLVHYLRELSKEHASGAPATGR